MSIRQMFGGSIVKPGFNPLAAQTSSYTYYLSTWGYNNAGQLGLGNITNYSSPKQVGSLTDWIKVGAGNNFCGAIKTDGTLWMWGVNNSGQLGFGNTTNYSSPKQVGALTNWSDISCGETFTLAIKTNGGLWAWGSNSAGELGVNTSGTNYSSPKQVGALTTWSKVYAGESFGIAIKTDGTLWSWGNNTYGKLGVGNTTNYSSPVQVGALTNWNLISKSPAATSVLAVKTDGTLWSWGRNQYGILGQNNTIYRSSPVQVGALTTWAAPGCSEKSALCVKTDGTLWTWGFGFYGQLGLNNTTDYSSPKQVGGLTTWLKVCGGQYNSFAIKTDGTIWSWGRNQVGQLGVGNTTTYSSPKQVGSGTTWYLVAASGNTTISLLY